MPFKDHFSGHAAMYRSARPTYPPALFGWLASQAPATELAWDVGCGNGQVAQALAGRFEHVHASDPSAQQIAQATPHPRIGYAVEPAERCSLGDAGADLVTVGQALHWFDFAGFFAEVRRVAKPGAVLAVWSYADVHVTPDVDALKDRVYVDLTGPYWPPERPHVDNGYADVPFPFAPVEAPRFEMVMHWSAAQFLAYLRSWSASQRYRQATGEDAVASIESALLRAWGDSPRDVRWDFHLRVMRVTPGMGNRE
ncbi:MAG TPA: class I SAM-dependent methyltransferase [Rhodanobacteraceae bacterium]|nr:class I SAM-dependent methyltransferase [Rhodanobacteraceae bacterium]